MNADGCARDIRHLLADRADETAVLLGHGIARGVGNIDHRGASSDGGLDHFEQITRIGAAGVFGVEFHVVRVLASQLDGIHRHLQNFDLLLRERFAVFIVLEFPADMDVRRTDAGVNARPFGLGQRPAAGFDVVRDSAGKSADGRSLDLLTDELDGLEVFRRRRRVARLDHVDVQLRQLPGDHELLAAA